ncbi:MAG: hypothetical protein V4547_18980 [Bacteroidota bacterium]
MTPIAITSQEIFKELSAASVNWALANPGDKIRIETQFKVQIVAISSIDSPFVLNKIDGLIGAGWVYDPDNQFGNFNIGDAVKVWNYSTVATMDAGDFTIIDKQGNGLIQLDHAIPTIGNDYSHESVTISNKTPITAVKYHYNFIKNNNAPTFISAIDGVSDQCFVIDYKLASDVASSNMKALGAYEWQDGFTDGAVPMKAITYSFGGSGQYPATIVGVSIDTGAADGIYKSTYKVIHYTKLNPFLLYQANIPPYLGSNCLKLITQIEAMKLYTDPNILHSAIRDNVIGNTGWYDENFNTGITNYKISNLTYKVAGVAVASIQLDATETVIEFDIENTVDTPFIASPTASYTEYVIGFHKVPADPAEYQNTGNLLDANFLYDRLFGGVAGSANNGINYGGTYQVLKGYASTLTSTSKIHIKVGVLMSAAVLASFSASSTPKYYMSFQVRKKSLATNVGDDVTLEIDQNTFTTVTSDPTMIVFDNKNAILRHPESNVLTEGVIYPTAANVFPEDELSANSVFYIESATRLTDVIKLTSVKAQTIVSNGTTTFVLDEFNPQLSAYPFIGYAQYFDLNIADQFHIPVAETIRKYYHAKRRTDLDTGTRFYFSINYPVLFRWETWTQALGVDSSFFNISLPNNGFNQWWFRYKTGAFRLYYRIIVNATKNGVAQSYTQQQELTPHDYSSTAGFTIKTIKTYDLAGTQLVSGSDYFVSGFANTEIRAVFKNTTAPFAVAGDYPNYAGAVVEIGIETFESGGISGKRRYSSKWTADGDTWFASQNSVSAPLKVYLSMNTDGLTFKTVTAKVLLDYTQIPQNTTAFKITARIYDNIAGTWQEECITQKVLTIPSNPAPTSTVPDVPLNPLPGCCNDFIIPVLANASGLALENDVTNFIYWFESITTAATLNLHKWNGSAWTSVDFLSNNDCGTYHAFNFFANDQGQKFIQYTMDWSKVLALYGTGSYKVIVSYVVPVFGTKIFDSYEYCLKTYSAQLAEGTVRLEYWLNGVTGDIEDDTKYKDFGTLNVYNSLRVKGFFGYPKSTYKSENVEYNNGQSLPVEDMQDPVFMLKLYLLPFFLHKIIETDFMMADRLAVTDYNSKNNATYIQKFVRKASGYEPKWYPMQSNLASVELQFKPESNRFRKLR